MTESKPTYGSIDTVSLESKKNNSKQGYRMILVTLVVLLVAVGGLIISQRENLQQILKESTGKPIVQNSPAVTSVPSAGIKVPDSRIQDRKGAWLEVSSENGNQLAVGETKKIYVKGNSGDRDITGYDMLISYDTSKIEIQSVNSALEDYEIFKFDRGNHMTITGIKNFQRREPFMFDGETILEIVVKAKQPGTTVVSLDKAEGQEKTQLVDAEVMVIEPQIGSIELVID